MTEFHSTFLRGNEEWSQITKFHSAFSRGEREAYLLSQCTSVFSGLSNSLLLMRAPGALVAGTLGADMPDLAAEVASAGEGVVSGVAACRV